MKFRRKRRLFTAIVAVEGVRIQRQRGSISPLRTVIFIYAQLMSYGLANHPNAEREWGKLDEAIKRRFKQKLGLTPAMARRGNLLAQPAVRRANSSSWPRGNA